jgi:PIN domain nuclease of toxin-antitoxin system
VAGLLIDTHVLLWMLDGTLPRRSTTAAERVADAIAERTVHVSIGSFLDLLYLVDAGRLSAKTLEEADRIAQQEAFSIVALDLAGCQAMRKVSREQVPDPFDRIIAATALLTGLPLVTADTRIQRALGTRAVWR